MLTIERKGARNHTENFPLRNLGLRLNLFHRLGQQHISHFAMVQHHGS